MRPVGMTPRRLGVIWVACAVAGCSTAAPIHSSTPPPTTTKRSVISEPSPSTRTTPYARPCTYKDLRTSDDGVLMGMAGAMLQYLTLTNLSASACSIYGLPTRAEATDRGHTFVIHVPAGTALDQPEDPGPVILPPNGSAGIALTAGHAAGYNRQIVYSALSFQVQSVGRLTWHGSFEPDNGFRVGPLTIG